MRQRCYRPLLSCLLPLGACASSAVPPTLAKWFSDAPGDATPRLMLAGDRIVAAAAPLGPGSLPPAVRTTFEAVAPGGETLFVGREWSERGEGFRLEKRYREGAVHTRSVLASPEGAVLERWHTVPIPQVPQQVLAAALQQGPLVDEARIVSGPEREEYWDLVARDRSGRTFVVRVALDGDLLATARRVSAQVETR